MHLKRSALVIGLGLALTLAWLLESPGAVYADEITVCPAGPPTCDYSDVQQAVDAAITGDVIKVATGLYTGVEGRPVPPGYLNPPASGLITQVVYLSETLTLQGGYTTTNAFADPPDPVANPTTLDAQGQGRALVVAGSISPTIQGLRFTGGNASGLGGYSGVNWPDHDTGGGICVVGASAVFSDNLVFDNTAGAYGSGGGMYLLNSSATLRNSAFATNTANALYGGAMYTMFSDASLTHNTFSGNTAGWGGAVFLEFSPASLVDNTFTGNACIMAGGALNVHTSDALIAHNLIAGNQASEAGGAMRLYDSAAVVDNNLIVDNVTPGYGGAVHMWSSSSTLVNNTISGNTAAETGGALEFWLSDDTFVNNLIVDNQSGDIGTAMYVVWYSSPRFLHNTIANNTAAIGGEGSAIYVDYYQGPSSVWLTNTILYSHTVGVNVVAGNTAVLEATLWGNNVEWTGDGTIITGTINVWGDPAFADPTGGDYHLSPGSAAIDAGVDAGVTNDIDGELRPIGSGYDLGADESGCRYVATDGTDVGNTCTDRFNPCATIQHAVDVSTPGEEIRVAAGVYTDVAGRPVPAGYQNSPVSGLITQVVYLSKTLTLEGSYTTTNAFAAPPDPVANPTTLDAQGQGRVLFIAGSLISPTVEYLRLTGGDATGLGGHVLSAQTGGGIYVISATATINHNLIFNNIAGQRGSGGGLFLYRTDSRLVDNTIAANDAGADGGGLYLWDSPSLFIGNVITANTAITWGGGLFMSDSAATLDGNLIVANQANYGAGMSITGCDGASLIRNTVVSNTALSAGGMYLGYTGWTTPATIMSNTFSFNTTIGTGGGIGLIYGPSDFVGNLISHNTSGQGAGLYSFSSDALFDRNTFLANTASNQGGGVNVDFCYNAWFTGNVFAENVGPDGGGGLKLSACGATIRDNDFFNNSSQYGGGLYLQSSPVTLSGNRIIANAATALGGGLLLESSNALLTNNMVSDNQSGTSGSGLAIVDSKPQLRHTTIARNQGGDGSGVYVAGTVSPSMVTLTNTILVSHTRGISIMAGNIITLEATLWGNQTDWFGEGTIVTGTVNVWGDPDFVNPEAGDYHLGPASAAIDAGIDAGVTTDIDGEPRPIGLSYDLGADESPVVMALSKQAVPDPVQAGGQLTYTLYITNHGLISLTATITDSLPEQVTPGGVLIWPDQTLAPGNVWTQTVIVTVEQGYSGALVNRLEVATIEGATGVYTLTTQAYAPPNQPPYAPTNPIPADGSVDVPITPTLGWQAGDPDGDPLTYTVALGPSDPPPVVAQVTITTYDPGPLDYATTYYWTITASDGISTTAGPTWSFSTVSPPCTRLTSVTLSITNPGTLYTDTLITFQADLTPDQADPPYHYRLTVDGAPGEVLSATAEPWHWTDTFPTTGTHTVQIAVWNCEMSEATAITDVVQFQVYAPGTCVGLEQVAILGASSGYPGIYTFTTHYTPAEATLPIDYLWDDDGTGSISIRNLDVGTHTLTVTAANCVEATATATHTLVIVEEPISCTQVAGVDLSLSVSGTLYLNTPVLFNADIAPDEATRPYSYTLDPGDGTAPITATGYADPLTFSHTFANAGAFTVHIAVWNCGLPPGEAVTDSLTIDVAAPAYTLYLPIVLRDD